jgi:hypothetical protein
MYSTIYDQLLTNNPKEQQPIITFHNPMQLFSATSWRANYEKTYSGILAIFFLRKRPELELAQFFSKDYWNFLYFCQVTSMENKASAMVFHKVH